MLWLIISAVGGVSIAVLLWLVISQVISQNQIKRFTANYTQISLSMTKNQVIELMGTKYISNAVDGKEILVWHQQKNSAIERELLSKKPLEMTATVVFENGYVIRYSLS